MSPTRSIVAVSILGLNIVACAGCSDTREPQRPTGEPAGTPETGDSALVGSLTDADKYAACEGTLTAFEPDHPWFDDTSVGHDDGVAPLATFAITAPAKYAQSSVGILFKHAADQKAPEPPDQSDIGDAFSFEIPEQFFAGKFKTVDNSVVRQLRKIEP